MNSLHNTHLRGNLTWNISVGIVNKFDPDLILEMRIFGFIFLLLFFLLGFVFLLSWSGFVEIFSKKEISFFFLFDFWFPGDQFLK
jgi:hypothetical protein